jgi:hypothetical protein
MDLVWDEATKRFYKSGLDRGVLYPMNASGEYPLGVPWNGLTSINESPSGAETTDLYANNAKYGTLVAAETFGGTIEAYTYPDEFAMCDGSVEPYDGVLLKQQSRQAFGLAYRVMIGNDVSEEVAYEIHLVYGCRAKPSEASLATVNENREAQTFSWEFTTDPITAGGSYKPTSQIVIDSRTADPTFLTWLENQLYGDDPNNDPNLPLPAEILAQAAM